jgi:hypothetical protein
MVLNSNSQPAESGAGIQTKAKTQTFSEVKQRQYRRSTIGRL